MKRILTLGRNCSEQMSVNASGLLVDGEAYFRAFYEAAIRARTSILLCGWQFDTEVALLRGAHADRAGGDVRLLTFLNTLCERNANLHIHVLAWDYSFIYALERQWLQQAVFELRAHPNIHFKYDNNTPMGASHHQKYVVVDGELGFVGGMDLCEHRWDDRRHAVDNPLRVKSSGLHYGPFHDVQAFVQGREACGALVRLFKSRWRDAHHEEPRIRLPRFRVHRDFQPPELVAVHARRCAISRTAPRCEGNPATCVEIRQLMSDAILAAEHLIYIETQYISAKSVEEALVHRMLMRNRGTLDILIILPQHPGELKERFAVGLAQSKLLSLVREVAQSTGHHLGVYYSAGADGGEAAPTYIHSKVMAVDDRFLTVGSANLTNRSLGVDTELHVSWENDPAHPEPALTASIRDARVDLLAEHSGLLLEDAARVFGPMEGMVERVDALARGGGTRLRLQQDVVAPEDWLLPYVDIDALTLFDPDEPTTLDEEFARDWKDLWTDGLAALTRKLQT